MVKLCAFIFSGTGNTRYVADRVIKKLSLKFKTETYEITAKTDFTAALLSSDYILIAYPIYGSAPPVPVRKFLNKYAKTFDKRHFIIIVTQYMFSGDGAATAGRTIEKNGGKVIAAEHFNMPNNLSDVKIFPIKNGEEIASVVKAADRKADALAGNILKGKTVRRGFGILSHAVGFYSQRIFWMKGEKEKRSKLQIDKDLCASCGLCVKHCPVENIKTVCDKPLPQGKCVFCYRCVNLCPKKAITLIGKAPPKIQYKGIPKR